jgi:hypothetical protein
MAGPGPAPMSIAAKPSTAVDPRRRADGKRAVHQQVFKDLEHPAVTVGQVKHEVGQRLRRVVELENIAAGKYPRKLRKYSEVV